MHFYNNFRKECLRHGRFDMSDAVVLCGIVETILHVSHRQAIGSPSVGISMDISMDIPMDIHEKNLWIWMWIWMRNFISTASHCVTYDVLFIAFL